MIRVAAAYLPFGENLVGEADVNLGILQMISGGGVITHVIHGRGTPYPCAVQVVPNGQLLLDELAVFVIVIHLPRHAIFPVGGFAEAGSVRGMLSTS